MMNAAVVGSSHGSAASLERSRCGWPPLVPGAFNKGAGHLSKSIVMRISIKIVRELDGSAVHERVIDVIDGRIGSFVDEVFEQVWSDIQDDGPGKYKLLIEKAEGVALV
jgi:hypothetical protein